MECKMDVRLCVLKFSVILTLFCEFCYCAGTTNSGKLLESYFRSCRRSSNDFDECVKNGLNSARELFKSGVPEYGISPFDPFYIEEVSESRGGPLMNVKLTLRNVYESGWTKSYITAFRSDFKKRQIKLSQTCLEKALQGEYEFQGTMFQSNMNNKGVFNMTLYDYNQTITVTRHPIRKRDGSINYNTPIKLRIVNDGCGDMNLHISNLIGGRRILEGALDRVINRNWRPGFNMLRPFINDIVSTAFTKIMDDNFHNFPFNKLFPE